MLPPKKKRKAEPISNPPASVSPTPSAGSRSPAGAPDAAVGATAILQVSTGTGQPLPPARTTNEPQQPATTRLAKSSAHAPTRSSVETQEGTSSGVSVDRATAGAFLAAHRVDDDNDDSSSNGDPAEQHSLAFPDFPEPEGGVALKQQVDKLKQELAQRDRELAQRERELAQRDRELAQRDESLRMLRSSNRLLAAAMLGQEAHLDDEDALNDLSTMVAEPSQDKEDQRKSEILFTAKLMLYLLLLFRDVAQSMPLKKLTCRRAKKG
jgi:hypothetical protein